MEVKGKMEGTGREGRGRGEGGKKRKKDYPLPNEHPGYGSS